MYDKDSPMIAKMSEFTKDKCFEMLDEIKRIMIKMNGYFFCNDSLVPHYCNWAINNKFKYTILTWNKPLSILNRERYSTNMEYIVRIYGNGTALNKLDFDVHPEKKEYYSKYRYANQIRGKEKYHPLQKPLELLNGFIELSSNEGDIVCDPFMGSGSTGVSCKKLNRKFIGIEMDGTYYSDAEKRINEA